ADIEGGSGGHIVILVADQEALADIDRPFTGGLLQHAGAGLSTAAKHSERLDDAFRMMGTIIKCIDMGAMLFEAVLHVRMEGLHRGFVIIAAGDPGLICDDKNVISGLVQAAPRLGRSFNPFELFGLVPIAAVDIQDTVAIKKCRRTEISFFVRMNRGCMVTHWFSPGTSLDGRAHSQPPGSPIVPASGGRAKQPLLPAQRRTCMPYTTMQVGQS